MTTLRALPDGFLVRDGLDDAQNYAAVVTRNEYRLPDRFPDGAVVVDIGAQCGTFSHAVLQRGAGQVFAYEASAGNVRAAAMNLSDALLDGRSTLTHAAVWRSDGRGSASLSLTPADDPACTGGGNVLSRGFGETVRTIPLDVILLEASDQGRHRIHLLKIDCEGAEWPILLTATRLDLVDQIVGEYHEIGGTNAPWLTEGDSWPIAIPEQARVDGYDRYTAHELQAFLEAQGFAYTLLESFGWFGLFAARRSPR